MGLCSSAPPQDTYVLEVLPPVVQESRGSGKRKGSQKSPKGSKSGGGDGFADKGAAISKRQSKRELGAGTGGSPDKAGISKKKSRRDVGGDDGSGSFGEGEGKSVPRRKTGKSSGNRCSWIGRPSDNFNTSSWTLKSFDVEERPIGKGGCGFVQIAKLRNSQKHFALKVIPKQKVIERDDIRHLRNEKELLQMLDHPFIINLFTSFQDSYYVYLALECVVGGELFTFLKQSRRFSDAKAKFYAAEVFAAVQYLHERNVAWRDLKPENCLLDEEGHIKIADFGFATEVADGERLFSKLGTPHYLAPELLNTKHSGGYTAIVDWWAFGCFVYELLTGNSPFGTASDSSYAVYLRVMKGRYKMPGYIQPAAKKLIKALLTPSIEKRLTTIQAIKAQEWFEEVDWGAVEQRRLKPPHIPSILFPGDTRNFDMYSKRELPRKVSLSKDHQFLGF